MSACGGPPTEADLRAQALLDEPGTPVLDDSAPAVARAVFAAVRPAALERSIAERPELIPGLWATFGAALSLDPGDAGLAGSVTAVARHRADRLARAGAPWSDADLALLTALQLVDPARVARDATFATLIQSFLPRTVDPTAAVILRDAVLETLAGRDGVSPEAVERAARAWGAVPAHQCGT